MNTKSRIEKLDNQGRGITYFENKITFVENALEGERVSLVNLKRTKKTCKIIVEAPVLSKKSVVLEPKQSKTIKLQGCSFHVSWIFQLWANRK